MKSAILPLVFLILFASVVFAATLPPNLENLRQAEVQQAQMSLQNISFIIAFIAGILSLFSPCILPTVPAFFAYTFKEKSAITRMTLVFFAGFAIIFVILGMIAAYLGSSLAAFPEQYTFLPVIGGLFMIAMGILELANRGFSSFIKPKARKTDAKQTDAKSVNHSRRSTHDTPGIFIMGNAFAVGWSACLGPILFGILSIAAVLGNYAYAAFLMLSYSLGIFVPLFILAFFYDRYNFGRSRLVRGREVAIGKWKIHSTKLISGLLFIIIGLVFIFFEGTAVVNTFDLTGTKQLFYDWQRDLLGAPWLLNALGLIALGILLYLIWRFVRNQGKK